MKSMLKQEGYRLVGAAFEVYNEKGHGFLEEVYQECLEIELELQQIPFASQPELPIHYKGRRLNKYYRPDLYVYHEIVTELKAVKQLTDDHRAQLLNYLKGTNKNIGYLLNFGNPEKLEWERFIYRSELAKISED